MNFSKTSFHASFWYSLLFLGVILACGPMGESLEGPDRLDVSHNVLVFEDPDETKKLQIINTSNYPVNWSLESLSEDVLVSPFGGILAANGVQEVDVRWLSVGSDGALRSELLILKSGNTVAREIEVRILAPQAGRWMLEDEILDAVYDPNLNRIWALASNRRLLMMDPDGKNLQTIVLEIQGSKLSIDPTGNRILVGHESAFSYLELPDGQLIQRKSVPFPIHDLLLGSNDWVYITDSQQQHSHIYAVNLQGSEADYAYNARIYSNANISMHPSGEYLLLASTSTMPDDVYKFRIEGGWPRLLYDSPYHGDYRFGGKVWFDRTGTRFFTRTGNVHQFSDEQVWDLRYVTKFPGTTPFVTMIPGQRKPFIYTVRDENVDRSFPTSAQPSLAIFNASDYRQELSVTLPRQSRMVNGEVQYYSTEIPFAFVNSQEDKMYLIEKGRNQENNRFSWSILTVPIN